MSDAPDQLPILHARRMDFIAEEVRYVARPGLLALPSGTWTVLLFITPQIFSALFLLWAIWWPEPATMRSYLFAWAWTAVLMLLAIGVVVILLRRNPGFAMGVIRAPFIRLTVTDRRVIWSLPWAAAPLMEIDRRRVTGGILGSVDRRGRGNAAMMLVPGDPAADVDGNIHFDRLPNVTAFVAALARMG
ncbi:MAG: hypothetical protein JWM75_949 [Sphingomonas bacterium]|nr:hypothetical protein [Sphingomonas bacterium]